MQHPISRRRLLAAAGAAPLVVPGAPRAQTSAPVVLTAGRRTLEVNGRAAGVFAITQADGTHGLFTELGTPFRVTLRNDAGVDTLIHWHGLTPPYQQDGVPGVSGPPVAPGETARYDFPLTFAGTYWMHSHEGLQEQALMSGPLIVRDPHTAGGRQEIVLMLHDFSFTPAEEIFAALRRAPDGKPGTAMARDAAPDLNDVSYDAFLANDRTLADPQVVRVEKAGRVLLRTINGAAASNFRIDLGAVQARLVAVDGWAVQPVTGTTFPIAVAQRLDLAIDLPGDQPVLPLLAVLEGERKRAGIVLAAAGAQVRKLDGLAPQVAAPLGLTLEHRLRPTAPLASKPADRVHLVDLTGDMAAYVWTLNGRVYGQDRPLMVASGQRVELVMANRTMMSHPMHLHGHTFQVVAIDGRRFDGARRDTVLVPPMRTVTVAFDADNPGKWAFHCHNLYHLRAGMMTTVQYESF